MRELEDFKKLLDVVEKNGASRSVAVEAMTLARSGDWSKAFEKVEEYSSEFANELIGPAVMILTSVSFAGLSSRLKAMVVRDVLSGAAVKGYSASGRLSSDIMNEQLKASGKGVSPVVPNIDEDRLDSAVAGTIKHSIGEDYERAGRAYRDSFTQLIASGAVRTQEATVSKLRAKGNIVAMRRSVRSANPCDYCLQISGKWFFSDERSLFKFHDSCRCVLETVFF